MQMYSLRVKILFLKYALYFLAYVLADPANKVLFKSCILEWGTLSLHPLLLCFYCSVNVRTSLNAWL